MSTTGTHDIFISYRRDGGESLAMLLHDRLADAGYQVFLDVEALNSGDFNVAILAKIRTCTDMLVVLPPHGLDRCVNEDDWVRREIEFAIEHGKNIIPIMMRGFEWPDALPESLACLPTLNGVTANNLELFDGVLLRLQTKLLHSKPAKKQPEQAEDPEFMRMYHRFQYLMSRGEYAEADGVLLHMQEVYPERAEVYLCRVQHICQLPHWDELGAETTDFENEPDWQYALRIAPPALKEQMTSLLEDSLALREKRAAEYRLEQERKAEAARAAKLLREEEKRRKKEEARQRAEMEREARIQKALPVRDEAMRRLALLQAQSPVLSQLDELYKVRDMLLSVQEECQTEEQVEACTRMIAELLEGPAEEAKIAAEILRCYAVCCDSLSGMAKMDRDFYERIGKGHIWRREIKGTPGVVSVVDHLTLGLIGLLADGTLLPMNRDIRSTNVFQVVGKWEGILSLTMRQYVIVGLRADGTIVGYHTLYPEHHGFVFDEWSGIVSLAKGQDHETTLTAGMKKDGTVATTLDHADWRDIIALNTFGPLLIGSRKNGETVAACDFIFEEFHRKALLDVRQWRNIADIAGCANHGEMIGRRTDGTLEIAAYTSDRYHPEKKDVRLDERQVCHVTWFEPGNMLVLRANGDLILYHEDYKTRTLLLSGVVGFTRAYMSYKHRDVILALLRDGRVAEIKPYTWESKVYPCAMTEEAVRAGVRNWRQLQARKLLEQREKELRSPFMFGKRKERCQRSIRVLKELLGQAN